MKIEMRTKTDMGRIISKLKAINTALPGLLGGIAAYGVLLQAAGIFIVSDKPGYSIGLWVGIITASFMAIHMAVTLNSAVERDVKGAQVFATKQNIIRYFIVIIILSVPRLTRIGNPIAAFAGIMGLKISAYLQPMMKKLLGRGKKEN